jgi:hypothetical protein
MRSRKKLDRTELFRNHQKKFKEVKISRELMSKRFDKFERRHKVTRLINISNLKNIKVKNIQLVGRLALFKEIIDKSFRPIRQVVSLKDYMNKRFKNRRIKNKIINRKNRSFFILKKKYYITLKGWRRGKYSNTSLRNLRADTFYKKRFVRQERHRFFNYFIKRYSKSLIYVLFIKKVKKKNLIYKNRQFNYFYVKSLTGSVVKQLLRDYFFSINFEKKRRRKRYIFKRRMNYYWVKSFKLAEWFKSKDSLFFIFSLLFRFIFNLFYVPNLYRKFRLGNLLQFFQFKNLKIFLGKRGSFYYLKRMGFNFLFNNFLNLFIRPKKLRVTKFNIVDNFKISKLEHAVYFLLNRSIIFLVLLYNKEWKTSINARGFKAYKNFYKRNSNNKIYDLHYWFGYERIKELLKKKRFKLKEFLKFPNYLHIYWKRKYISILYNRIGFRAKNSFLSFFFVKMFRATAYILDYFEEFNLLENLNQGLNLARNSILRRFLRKSFFKVVRKSEQNNFIFYLGMVQASFYHKGFHQFFLSYDVGWKNYFNVPLMANLTRGMFGRTIERFFSIRNNVLELQRVKYLLFFKNELRKIRIKIFSFRKKKKRRSCYRFQKKIRQHREVRIIKFKYRPRFFRKRRPKFYKPIMRRFFLGSHNIKSKSVINLIFSNIYGSLIKQIIGNYGLVHFQGFKRFIRGKFWSSKKVAMYYYKQRFFDFYIIKIDQKNLVNSKKVPDYLLNFVLGRFIFLIRRNFIFFNNYLNFASLRLSRVHYFYIFRGLIFFFFFFLNLRFFLRFFIINSVLKCHS